MPRKILAGVVVLAFALVASTALAANEMPLSYQTVRTTNANQAVMKLYLENTKGMVGGSIPVSFGLPGSDIQCTKIDFTESRVEHFQLFPNIDNQNKKLLIGMIRALDENIDDALMPGEGLLATLYFNSKENNCRPDLKVTVWPLSSSGKLYLNMVNEWSKPICRIKIGDDEADIPIPMKPSDAEVVEEVRPSVFSLEQNYPNPFNPETIIKFSLAQDSPVTLRIYNILGQAVTTLVDESLPSGIHSVVWDGKNQQGMDVASGVYFYRIKAGDFESTQRMTLLR